MFSDVFCVLLLLNMFSIINVNLLFFHSSFSVCDCELSLSAFYFQFSNKMLISLVFFFLILIIQLGYTKLRISLFHENKTENKSQICSVIAINQMEFSDIACEIGTREQENVSKYNQNNARHHFSSYFVQAKKGNAQKKNILIDVHFEIHSKLMRTFY